MIRIVNEPLRAELEPVAAPLPVAVAIGICVLAGLAGCDSQSPAVCKSASPAACESGGMQEDSQGQVRDLLNDILLDPRNAQGVKDKIRILELVAGAAIAAMFRRS